MLTDEQKRSVSSAKDKLAHVASILREIAEERRKHHDGQSANWRDSEIGLAFSDELRSLEWGNDELEIATQALGNVNTDD